MSCHEPIKGLIDAGLLHAYVPKQTRKPSLRRLFLTNRAWNELHGAGSATNILCGQGYIEAALTKWVIGGYLNGDTKGRFLADLCPPPPEIWEIRVTEPRPQARLFGRFAEPDTLLLTNFHTRSHLGDKGSEAWMKAMGDCEDEWNQLEGLPLLVGTEIADYVTENHDEYPIKRPCRKQSAEQRVGRVRNRSPKR